ncbi:hypothetical protein FGO68_gene34 [Halteria grandinella]|uniref:Uncharacterized protein n=1 Tax=Halteria grandinella TaxID=5974 RepID=A0A8J8T673_HALGN|nr:hypothetical protein FGO68_gene34 [Halteria grandinella]
MGSFVTLSSYPFASGIYFCTGDTVLSVTHNPFYFFIRGEGGATGITTSGLKMNLGFLDGVREEPWVFPERVERGRLDRGLREALAVLDWWEARDFLSQGVTAAEEMSLKALNIILRIVRNIIQFKQQDYIRNTQTIYYNQLLNTTQYAGSHPHCGALTTKQGLRLIQRKYSAQYSSFICCFDEQHLRYPPHVCQIDFRACRFQWFQKICAQMQESCEYASWNKHRRKSTR